MSPEILKKYAKSIEDLERWNNNKEDIDITRTSITCSSGVFKILIKDNRDYEVTSIPTVEFTYEERSRIGETIMSIIENKLQLIKDEQKKEFQKMLLDKL